MTRRTHQSAWSAHMHGKVRPMRPEGELSLMQGTTLLAAGLGIIAGVVLLVAVAVS